MGGMDVTWLLVIVGGVVLFAVVEGVVLLAALARRRGRGQQPPNPDDPFKRK